MHAFYWSTVALSNFATKSSTLGKLALGPGEKIWKYSKFESIIVLESNGFNFCQGSIDYKDYRVQKKLKMMTNIKLEMNTCISLQKIDNSQNYNSFTP